MTALRDAISAIAAQHPELCAAGWPCVRRGYSAEEFARQRWEMLTAAFEQQVLDTIVDVGSLAPKALGSYGLKHRVEARCGRYVSSGAAIVAMLLLGFEVVRGANDLHCRFRRPRTIAPHLSYRGDNCHTWGGR